MRQIQEVQASEGPQAKRERPRAVLPDAIIAQAQLLQVCKEAQTGSQGLHAGVSNPILPQVQVL